MIGTEPSTLLRLNATVYAAAQTIVDKVFGKHAGTTSDFLGENLHIRWELVKALDQLKSTTQALKEGIWLTRN